VIRSPGCLAEGAAHLARIEPRFAYALDATGPLPLRLRDGGFAALMDAIVSQQVSVAAANAIWARLEFAGMTLPGRVMTASDDDLRACGLSRQKVRYVRELALAAIDYDALSERPTDEVIAPRGSSGHRPLDGRDLCHVLSWPGGCLRAGRSCPTGSGAYPFRTAGPPP
jgi:DNA-3-methyladenine glycosylase II